MFSEGLPATRSRRSAAQLPPFSLMLDYESAVPCPTGYQFAPLVLVYPPVFANVSPHQISYVIWSTKERRTLARASKLNSILL